MTSPLLRVENLSVSFAIHGAPLYAVRGISFDVLIGESVGLVGESGCGKSAAMQALLGLGLTKAVQGKALFDGENLLEHSAKFRGRKIGMVFQDPMASLNPTMKIGQQIAEGLIFHRLASKQEALQKSIELLKLVRVDEPELRLSQYPHMLSGGMRQRVLIAIALSCKPRLLIADEPTTALDPTISSQILALLKHLQQTLQMAMLLVSHDLNAIASACTRVLVMYAGKIVESGPVNEVFSNPKHPYTRMLLNAVPRLDRPKSAPLTPIEGSPPSLFSIPVGCSFAPRCPHASDQCRINEPPLVQGKACWRTDD